MSFFSKVDKVLIRDLEPVVDIGWGESHNLLGPHFLELPRGHPFKNVVCSFGPFYGILKVALGLSNSIVTGKQVIVTAFSYDYYRFVLRKQIIRATFSDSEKLPQDHYK